MLKSTKGFIVFIALLIITLLMILVISISTLLFNEINIGANDQKGVKAFYLAEAGIEKALYILKNQATISEEDFWQIIEEDDWNQGFYELNVEKIPFENDNDYYKWLIESTASIQGLEKQIVAKIEPLIENYPTRTVNTAGQIIGLDKIIIEDYWQEIIINFLAEHIYEDYLSQADIIYEQDKEMSLVDNWQVDDKIIYAQGDLEINANCLEIIASKESKALFIVKGDLSLTDVKSIKNCLFLVKGNYSFTSKLKDCIIVKENVLFYTEGSVEINSYKVSLTGQIITKGDCKFLTEAGSTACFKAIDLVEELENLTEITIIDMKISNWQEGD